MARKPLFRFGLLGLAGLPYAFLLFGSGADAQAKQTGAYEDVVAIFKAHCLSCHTGKTSSAGLDLSTPAGIQKGGISGKMTIAGKPDASLLMKRVLGQGGMPQMPMGFAPLTKKQLDTLRGWIASGAKIGTGPGKHWAYIAPKRLPVPQVKDKAWVRNPIDSFVLSRLEKQGLKPSPQASRETLLRRVSLDLTGLPPTLQEIDAFLADKSPNAYEKVVDRLLASKHYGEFQAQRWMDLARYADTDGYEKDPNRGTAWKYRDWAINAFNANMTYDQFTIEQLAGDLLPKPTLEQMIATGFHRNTMFNTEGGVDPAEARYEMINDRVSTTSTVWLGQTMQCARCHDHKYDPISQKDYFRWYAIFANTEYTASGEKAFGGYKFYEKDMPAPSPEQATQLRKLEDELGALEGSLDEFSKHFLVRQGQWLDKARAAKPFQLIKPKVEATGGVTLKPQPDGTFLATGENTGSLYELQFQAEQPIYALRLNVVPDNSLPQKGAGRGSSGNFLLSGIRLKVNGKPAVIVTPIADFVQNGYDVAGLLDDQPETGWAIHPQVAQRHWLVVRPVEAIPAGATVEVELRNDSKRYPDHALGRFSLSATAEPEPLFHAIPTPIATALAKKEPTADDQEILEEFYERHNAPTDATWKKIDALRAQIDALKKQFPMAMVMTEKKGTTILQAAVHPRGEFLQKGPMVSAGIPAAFGKTDAKRVDRLALAKWLVSKENPLTARVQINRMWEGYWGTGFVETSENFGTPGSPPNFLPLYDWLSTEFMQRGWDLKAIHRLIVTSATYRQSSATTKALLERDPQNRLFARGPRFRMDAEMIRDNALSAAGMLSLKVGGPSVYPHQPDGIWNSPYNGERWMTSKGDDLYRRGLYTFWKRTATYPTFTNFDATSREVCTVRRIRTNTPLQALNLLNDQAFLEAAKGLAKRVGADIPTMFNLCTSRKAKPQETERLVALYNSLLKRYQQDPTESKKLAKTPEEAAMIMVANVILNLDETINKE